ncbi:protein-disulfide reductase DsbD [Bradyrhizobium sp. Tv2a-2]|uniref:protein-disulfide reductase DsbD n=1 Tax=Bradyrhizobium sp. Tv2a-2 TaxID=113395 RepID=UPI0004015D30|nr:protein-disulfide reductase DsbD [Bradyrhizobium sp. Tv2a-2]
MSYVRILRSVTLLLAFIVAIVSGGATGITPPDQAFQFSAEWTDKSGVRVSWSIAPGHYLYRDRIAASVDGRPVRIETDPGEPKDDPNFGPTEVYHLSTAATVAPELLPAKGSLIVTYQGCAENTICYPPISKAVDLSTLIVSDASDAVAPTTSPERSIGENRPAVAPTSAATTNIVDAEAATLFGNGLIPTLFTFLGLGILLSLTPCVFPMIPIMSGMLARSGEISLRRSFVLSASYVLAMAAAYGTLGVFAAWSGENLQAVLQTPLAIVGMSVVFIVLSLSMFGFFDLQLPQSWLSKFAEKAGNRGSVGGAAALGFGSALVVGPCVTPPLAAALVYVGQAGQMLRGSLALFALGLGMGLPLVAFGVLGAKVLPRSGAWLARTKHIFGFVFIALAIWMLSRVLPVQWVALAWSVQFFAIGGYFVSAIILIEGPRRLSHFAAAAIGTLSIVYGGALAAGAAIGKYEPLQALAAIGLATPPSNAAGQTAGFRVVRNEVELQSVIDIAREQHRVVMVDFSAEWCTVCKLMEHDLFSQDAVRQEFRSLLLVRADLTHFDQDGKNLMKRFAVVGPPTIVFLNPDNGREIQEARIVGDVSLVSFLSRLERAIRA